MCNALDERAAPCVMKVTSSERFLLFPPNSSLDRAISPARELATERFRIPVLCQCAPHPMRGEQRR